MINSMDSLIVFIALGTVLALFFAYLRYKTQKKIALYKLYAVRDELICLVAEDKISEDSPIFQYYYKKINLLLKSAPNVGLDDAMAAFLDLQSNKGFDQSLKEAVRCANEMLTLVESEPEEVGLIVAIFYSASKYIMLAHSSFLRMFYIYFFKKISAIKVRQLVTKGIYAKLTAVRFADQEAIRFRDVSHQHAS